MMDTKRSAYEAFLDALDALGKEVLRPFEPLVVRLLDGITRGLDTFTAWLKR
jgi:hypothetical protein